MFQSREVGRTRALPKYFGFVYGRRFHTDCLRRLGVDLSVSHVSLSPGVCVCVSQCVRERDV